MPLESRPQRFALYRSMSPHRRVALVAVTDTVGFLRTGQTECWCRFPVWLQVRRKSPVERKARLAGLCVLQLGNLRIRWRRQSVLDR